MDQNSLLLPSGKEASPASIRGACRFYGGVKAVAEKAGIKQSALSHWLAGKPSISTENLSEVLNVLEIPNGLPRTDKVLEWINKIYWGDMIDALRLYFPSGAVVSHTPWSKPGLSNMAKFFRYLSIGSKSPPEIYLMFDGKTRAIIRQPPGVLLYEDMMGEGFHMHGKDGTDNQVSIEFDEECWFRGPISREAFDRAFCSKYVGWENIVELAKEKEFEPKILRVG